MHASDSVARGFRPDIQALRAVAVLLVVVYHLAPGRVPGGYIGVDVFFVVSGFLIGSHLLREIEISGWIKLGTFWSRRAKRLLPAALLVLLVTSVATILWVPRSLWPQFLAEVSASTLYVENWRLGSDSVDYLASDNAPSPVQHYWSLSVEEQFYILTPLLLLGILLLSRRWRGGRRFGRRQLIGLLLALVAAASLWYAVWITANAPAAAYFSTFSRAWEFVFGVLVGFLPAVGSNLRRTIGVATGLGMITLSAFVFTSETPFPGVAALIPVVGTALAVWLGQGTFLARLGSRTPIAVLGDNSYAIYLWHWPLIILVPYVTAMPLDAMAKVIIVILTFMFAWISTRWEKHVRFSPRLLGRSRPRAVAVWSAAGMAVVLVIAGSGLAFRSTALAVAESQMQALVDTKPACLGAAALASPSCANPDLDGVLIPSPSDLTGDEGNRAECWSSSQATSGAVVMCQLGPKSGYSRHLIAVGDSHNNQFISAYEKIADAYGWRIDVAGRVGCYWTDAELQKNTVADEALCQDWKRSIGDYIAAERGIDAVITSKARMSAPILEDGVETSELEPVVEGLLSAWARRADPSQVPVIAIEDNPAMPRWTVACIEERGLDAREECQQPRHDVLPPSGLPEAVARDPNAVLIDLTDLYCDRDFCRPIVGNVIVYRDDGHHLTRTYTDTIAPYLGKSISDALEANE